MPKSHKTIQDILEWVEKSKKAYPEDTETQFLSRLINTHYKDKKSIDSIYETFEHINRPQKEILEKLSEEQPEDLTALSPYFLHFSWGLFQKMRREADPDEHTVEFQKFNANSRTISAIQMLARLGTLLNEDKKLRRQEDALSKYFRIINTLVDSGHLDIAGCVDMKASELRSVLWYVEGWIKLPILSEESANPALDITRHDTYERIRQLAHATLTLRCERPFQDIYRWDALEPYFMEDVNIDSQRYANDMIVQDIHDDMQTLHNELHNSNLLRTTHERSQLKQALILGYADTLERLGEQGYQKIIDLNIYIIVLNLTLSMSQQFAEHCDDDTLRKLIGTRKAFASRGKSYYREHLSLQQSLSLIAPYHSHSINICIFLTVALLALTYSDAEESGVVTRRGFEILAFINIACYAALSIILYRHMTEIGNFRIVLADTHWAEAALRPDHALHCKREAKFAQEKEDHDDYIAAKKLENKLRNDKPKIMAEQKKRIEEEVEEKLKAQDQTDRKSIEAHEKKILERQREERQEALRIKEERRRAHSERTHEKPLGNVVVTFAPQPPIAVPAREPAAAAPKIAAVIAIPPQPKQPPQEASAKVVMFALGDKRRDAFIAHIRTLMRIIGAHLKQPNVEKSPEGLAALKYDLMQICEHIFSIRSSQGCGQKAFIESLIHKNDIDLVYGIRNGLIHNDAALSAPDKYTLYLSVMNKLCLIGYLHQPGSEIKPNDICQQATAQPNDFPIRFNFETALQRHYAQLIAPQPQFVLNEVFKAAIEEKHAYLRHITQQYLETSNPEKAQHLSKVLLMTIAELGEIYKEIFVKQKLKREFGALYPRQTFNDDMIERFISVRRDIVHILDLKAGDVGVIVSNGGSVFIQDSMLKPGSYGCTSTLG